MPTLSAYPTQRGFIGVGVETTAGTPTANSSYVQLSDESISREPGIVLEKLMRGSRDAFFAPVLGEQKIAGKIDTPLYVDQGMPLFVAAIGADAWQYSVGATGSAAIGGSGIAAGVSNLTLATLPAGLAVGDYVQLQQTTNPGLSTTNLSELHKVASITGAGPYTVGIGSETTKNVYPATGVAWRVPGTTAVFSHALATDFPTPSAYKTLTVEKCLGGLTSLQWAGATVGKFGLKLDTKGLAKATYDVSALAEAQIAPSTPSYGASAPLALASYSVSPFGAADISIQNFELDLDNMAKEQWTFNGGNLPSLIPPLERKVSGKFKNVLQSMNYYNDMVAGTTGTLSLTLTQGAASIVFTVPKIVLSKLGVPLKAGELVLYDADFEAPYSDTSGYSVQVVVTNSQYLPLA